MMVGDEWTEAEQECVRVRLLHSLADLAVSCYCRWWWRWCSSCRWVARRDAKGDEG